MAGTVAENAAKVLAFLYHGDEKQKFDGANVSEGTGLQPAEVNDAVTILVENGYAEALRFLGTSPYRFGLVYITARGRVEHERALAATTESKVQQNQVSIKGPVVSLPPFPVGSPYGFEDEDWEIVFEKKGARDRLNVVFGYQFESEHYNSGDLVANTNRMFAEAVESYNRLPAAVPATLDFVPLSAGYGGHLFNQIARDIISADIAVFDTSNLNPNVMLEIGVALTWGVRVLIIKEEKCLRPPSDVSGHTWADYRESGVRFVDPTHADKLMRMVERAVRKKFRTNSEIS